jgi:transposase
MLFIGCDWSRSKHDLCAINDQGEILLRCAAPHSGRGLQELARTLADVEPGPKQISVAMELHDGAMLAWLLEQGYTVYGINPKSSNRARDRHRPSGSKDDQLDAFVLAHLLRTDRGHLRPIRPDSEATQELRAWVRLRAHTMQDKTACDLRLRGLLDEWCPGLSALCKDFNRQWQRALLMAWPLHQDLRDAQQRRLHAFFQRHRVMAPTRQRLLAVQTEPILPIPVARQEALRVEIRLAVQTIDQLEKTLVQIQAQLKRLVADHPDATVFQSLPVKGTLTIASLLAAFGQDRDPDLPSWNERAARWGVAPVTVRSGKFCHVKRRRACDHFIQHTLLFFAYNTAFTPGCWAQDYYRAKRQSGTPHYSALRCLAQRWVKILHRLWKDRVPYNETLHQTNRSIHGAPNPNLPLRKSA